MYKINPLAFDGVIPLPSSFAEKHLSTASLPQFKVLIYVYANINKSVEIEEISNLTGVKAEEVKDALDFWISNGLILEASAEVQAAVEIKAEKENKAAQPEKPRSFDMKPERLSRDMILQRLIEDSSLNVLFLEAQTKLGRTIGTSDQSALLLLHDYYGLPIEIILTICEYARTHGKSNNINYIYTMGVDWSKREIDTLEAADEELKQIENANTSWKEFCLLTGFSSERPTTSQEKYLRIWTNDWHFSMSMIVLAFEEMRNHTGDKKSFSYINKVLSAWNKKNIRTPEDVEKDKREFSERKEKEALSRATSKKSTKLTEESENTASYDIQKAELKAKTTVPKLKKREKR